jgi:glycosyltransferase involved in cell wall biosynthesis
MKRVILKADLHVHSEYSTRPSEWILRKLGCSESYTQPQKVYEIATQRGMDLVTITDHNSLAGSLEIAHLESTFVSEEITTYFPATGCKLHVLAFNITEAQHQDISRCRENVFDLTTYLNQEKIVHALAHPLFSVNDKLTEEHLEQALVLFLNFELNGSRDDFQNLILKQILENLTREDIERLADKHGLEPKGFEPWKKNLVGGSDDHSSVNIATTYTEVVGISSVEEYLQAIGQNRTRVNGLASSPKTLAHNLYSIAYQFYNTKFGMDRYANKDLLFRFMHRALNPSADEGQAEGFVGRLRNAIYYRRPGLFARFESKSVQGLLRKEARDIILNDPAMRSLAEKSDGNPGEMEEAWFRFVNQVSEKILKEFADNLLVSLSGANLFDVFHSIGSAGSLYTMLAPFFVSYTVFTKDRLFCSRCRQLFLKNRPGFQNEEQNIAHFTDTFYDINGVAMTLQMQVRSAVKNERQLKVLTCDQGSARPGVMNFEPIGTFEMPEYPDLKLCYPPLLKMLHYCYEQNFTQIHSATPGPVGLAALIIARILKRPLLSTYHTAIPQYAMSLTDDGSMEELMWKYAVWYYNQTDIVYAPSRATGEELIRKGIPPEKIRYYPRGIDVNLFHPSKRNGFYRNRFRLDDRTIKLLYVGRVSREKNLPLLGEIFRRLQEMRERVHMVVVGSGPYLEEMESELKDLPVTFAGFLEGEDLAQAYASSDIFLFPSTTDTFGNVVLEAQASGVPVIVSSKGGPSENMVPGKTGFVVSDDTPEAYLEILLQLVDNPELLRQLRVNARGYMEDRSFESANVALWNSYGSR